MTERQSTHYFGDACPGGHLHALLWRVADAQILASDDEHYAIALTHGDFEAIKLAVGYDDQGQ